MRGLTPRAAVAQDAEAGFAHGFGGTEVSFEPPLVQRPHPETGGLIVDERRGARTLLCGFRADDGALAFAGEAYVPPYLGAWLDGATRDFVNEGSPFASPIALQPGLRFMRPRLVAIVEHAGLENGELRDARFRALRFDGRLDDCRQDTPVEVPSYPPHTGHDRPRLVVLNSLPFPIE